MLELWAEDITAERNAPSKPYLTDEWEPTDPRLWIRVLNVAKGRKRQMTRVGPDGSRTIHAPHNGRGFRHWPNPKAIAWAVKQYNGYGGRWKGKGEEAVTASDESTSVYDHLVTLKNRVDAQTHTLDDVVEGRITVGVEGDSGKDIVRAKQLGLFTCNVAGVDIFSRCEEDARPLIHYLERGGTYGSLEFSKLLGYNAEELENYQRYLLLSAEAPQPFGLNAFQASALGHLRLGAVLTTSDESNEAVWMTDLERRGLAQLVNASLERNEAYWDITQAGVRVVVARLQEDLKKKMEDLLEGKTYDVNEAKAIADWLKDTFRFKSPKTPKGQKVLKERMDALWWSLAHGGLVHQSAVEHTWNKDIKPHLAELVRYFSDEGGTVIPSEVTIGGNTYFNKAGLNEETLQKYAKRIGALFDTITGWRAKALKGGVKVAFASPRDFRGTAGGKYRSTEDTLYVRTTPAVLKRSDGYASLDYILVHELGHRYERFNPLPEDFDKPHWWTSKYSRTEGMGGSESFAELFAIGHYQMKGPWDYAIVERFEGVMS
jgi:hypothetical protein